MLPTQTDQITLRKILRYLMPQNRHHKDQIFRVLMLQVYFTFIQALPLISIMAFVMGCAISLQANLGLSLVGGGGRIGEIFVMIICREAAPLAASILMIARSATAVAAETATMKQQREVEALTLMGIDPIEYVFAPRIIAGAISAFCLAFVFIIVALCGTWFAANYSRTVTFSDLINSVIIVITKGDIAFFVLKTIIPGLGIFWIACKSGLSLKKAPFEIPIQTINAVVEGLTFVMAAQFILSAINYTINGFHF